MRGTEGSTRVDAAEQPAAEEIMRSTRNYLPEACAVAEARHFAVASLNEWGLDPGDIPLLVSELPTNAVLHARSEFTLTLELSTTLLRVAVHDDNNRRPVAAVVPDDAYSGRGLSIVD